MKVYSHYSISTVILTCGMCVATASFSNCDTCRGDQLCVHTNVLLSLSQWNVGRLFGLPKVASGKKFFVMLVAP